MESDLQWTRYIITIMQIADFTRMTIGEIVAEDYRRATIFKRFGIDFCCGGGKTVAETCEKKGISPTELEEALLRVSDTGSSRDADARTWDLDFLADYIVNVHHRYVRENLPPLVQFATKVARVHGDAHPELHEIAELTLRLAADMEEHMAKEEQVLFPYVKALVNASRLEVAPSRVPFGTIRNPIMMMEHEHDDAGNIMKRLRELSNDFTPPEYACNTYRATFATLEDFESDLHRHVHLENNILFPRATALEDELRA